jgi:hypothetical protein
MSNDSLQPTPPHPDPSTAGSPGIKKGEGTRRRSRLKRAVVGMLVVVLALYFTYTPIISSIIGAKLHNMLESRLNATLHYDSLTYVFPYQVRLSNVHITTDQALGQTDLFTVEKLDLQLAKIPWPHTPLVIQSFELQSPALHVVKTGGGIVGAKGLKKSDEEQRLHPPEHRLSEMFELRKFVIADGEVVYDDRTVAGADPLVFRGVSVDLGVTPQSRGIYAYHFQSAQPPFVTVDASGTADIDSATLDLDKLSMIVESKRLEGESPLPPKLQKIVNEAGIAGKMVFDVRGQVPVRELSRMKISADANLTDARAAYLDQVEAQMHAEIEEGATQVQFTKIHANAFGGTLNATGNITAPNPSRYEVQLDASAIDLAKVEALPALQAHSVHLTGEGRITAHVTGEFAGRESLDRLGADGDAQVARAKFPESKTVSGIAERIGIARESLTTGDAAAVFSLRDRMLTIQRGAINTTVLGLQGNGTVNFDGDLNFDIIAAPLGDWRNHVQNMNIPLIGGVASNLAGHMQNLVSATSKMLYHFDVTGNVSDPKITAIPAPALTDKAANVFGKMMQDGNDLLKAVKEGG